MFGMKKRVYLNQLQRTNELELKKFHKEKKLKQLTVLNNMEFFYLP